MAKRFKTQPINVLFVNNEGGGLAEYVPTEEGTTIQDFLVDALATDKASLTNYLIRLNREEASADTVLKDKDRVTATPKAIKGA